MHKFVFLVKRADHVTHDELVRHWQEVHLAGVAEHLRPDHYRVTFFDQRDDTPFDGMAVLWYDDPERGRYMLGEGSPEAIRRDGFLERVQMPHVVLDCEEHVIVDGPRPEGRPQSHGPREREVGHRRPGPLPALAGRARTERGGRAPVHGGWPPLCALLCDAGAE